MGRSPCFPDGPGGRPQNLNILAEWPADFDKPSDPTSEGIGCKAREE
jgi:hypothetical protein